MARKDSNGRANELETVEALDAASTVTTDETVAIEEQRACDCGCGAVLTSKKARFVVGHDMRYKGALLRAFDAGDEEAGRVLVENGWKTEADLAARKEKSQPASKADRLAARIERLNVKIAKLVEERTALEAELAL